MNAVIVIFVVLSIIGTVFGIVFGASWVSDNWRQLKERYNMWRILRLKSKVVFFVSKEYSTNYIEVWYKTKLLLTYKEVVGDTVYSGSRLGQIHKMYKDSLQ